MARSVRLPDRQVSTIAVSAATISASPKAARAATQAGPVEMAQPTPDVTPEK